MDRENILNKVKKLFALAGNNSSEEEARQATLKAQELMVKHNIDMAEVDDVDLDKSEEITEVGVDVGPKKWKYTLAHIVADNFRCRFFMRGKEHFIFYGHETDARISAETFKFLFNMGNKLGNKLAREARAKYGYADNVYNSCVMGFCAGLKEVLGEQSVALMVVMPEDVKDAYEERTKGFRVCRTNAPRAYNGAAFETGRAEGRSAMGRKRIA